MFSLVLTLCMLDKNFSRWHFEIFFLIFPIKRIWHFMPVILLGDHLHEMSVPFFWEKWKIKIKKKIINLISLSSAEFAQRVVKINMVDENFIKWMTILNISPNILFKLSQSFLELRHYSFEWPSEFSLNK